jgi:hypothetical protein
MKRIGAAVAGMVAVAAAIGGMWVRGASASPKGQTIRIDAVVAAENFVDVEPVGPSLGDTLIVHDDWKDMDGTVVGDDGLVCTVTFIDPDGSTTFQCVLTGHLESGDLTAQGLFTEPAAEPPPASAVLAVTGGTGAFAGATGTVKVQEISEEETHFTFRLGS